MGNYLKYCVAERFRNIDKIQEVTCTTCFIHGKKDNLISYKHSLKLMKNCTKAKCCIYLSEKMTHNDFHINSDIILPI